MIDPGLLLLTLVFMGVGLLVSARLKSKFKHYSSEQLLSGLSGREVAEKMLKAHHIYDVKVMSVSGVLSDHYNPLEKTVNLSEAVYSGRNIAAAAVAAHECGHAVQHATAYTWLNLRSKLVPTVQIASNLMIFLTIGLAFVAYGSPNLFNSMLLVFISLQAVIAAFSLITLPVELDASRRALLWLNQSNVTFQQEQEGAKDALNWAAYTYVVAALGSVATLLYYVWRFTSSNRN